MGWLMSRPPSDLPVDCQVETRDWSPGEEPDEFELLRWTPDQFDAAQLYLDKLKVLMGLGDWEIFISDRASQEHTNASVHAVLGRRLSPIYLSKGWWTYSPQVQRNTMVHELLHLVHHFQSEVIRLTGITNAVWRQFEMHTEYMVDHLAGIIDQNMPLPITPQEVSIMRANKEHPFDGK